MVNLTINGKSMSANPSAGTVTVGEVLQIVRQDLPYYRRSGGGMTLSGGEMLCQSDFAYALLRAAKEAAINTAVETTGFAKWETIETLLPYIDTVLMDIKHVNSDKHLAYTSKPNELILENARYIAERAHEMIIRVPVIPTFNDTPEEIRAIATFAKGLPGVQRLHLLPYHRLGQDKYEALGREYTMRAFAPPTEEGMRYLLSVAEESGLLCQIGG